MSAYTKRKHVSKEVEEFDDLPNDRAIVKIVCGKGNNLHLVQTDNGEEYLVSMPTKFRKYVWVKRGELIGSTTCVTWPSKTRGANCLIRFVFHQATSYLLSQSKRATR